MLILSLFPGIDLLGTGFEQEGYCVVRGPDLIFGGDVRAFHPPAGRFDGVIGGPPCQDFSVARWDAPTGDGLKMLAEFTRVVLEARPVWWLMENVPGVPNVTIPGYTWQRIDLKASEFGLTQRRLRHFQFGDSQGRTLTIERQKPIKASEPCCLAIEGQKTNRRSWADFCQLQGLPLDFDLPSFTTTAKYRAVGNGVPVPMATAVARGILNLSTNVTSCLCGCGRVVTGKQKTAGTACRVRLHRRNVTMLVCFT